MKEMLAKCSRGKITPKKGLRELLNYRVCAGVARTILVFIQIISNFFPIAVHTCLLSDV